MTGLFYAKVFFFFNSICKQKKGRKKKSLIIFYMHPTELSFHLLYTCWYTHKHCFLCGYSIETNDKVSITSCSINNTKLLLTGVWREFFFYIFFLLRFSDNKVQIQHISDSTAPLFSLYCIVKRWAPHGQCTMKCHCWLFTYSAYSGFRKYACDVTIWQQKPNDVLEVDSVV